MSTHAYILMLAQDGEASWVFPIVVLIFAIVGSLFKKKAEKAEEKTRERRKVGRKADEDEGWIEIDSGQKPVASNPAQRLQNLRQAGPVIENRYRGAEPKARETQKQRMQKTPPPTPSRARRQVEQHQPLAPQTPTARIRRSTDVGIRVNLKKKRTAKAAVIFNEILSLPKALREGPERWDM